MVHNSEYAQVNITFIMYILFIWVRLNGYHRASKSCGFNNILIFVYVKVARAVSYAIHE